jgi:hypothetical protein
MIFLQIGYMYGTGMGGSRGAATKEGLHNDNGTRRFFQYVEFVYFTVVVSMCIHKIYCLKYMKCYELYNNA